MVINLDTKLFDLETEKPLTFIDMADAFAMTVKKFNEGKVEDKVKVFVDEVLKSKQSEMTVGLVLRKCLLEKIDKEQVDSDEAQRRYEVAREMMKGGEFDLSEKDRDVIKKNLAERYHPLVSGQIMTYINPRKKTEDTKKGE